MVSLAESEGSYFYSAYFTGLFMTHPGRVCTGLFMVEGLLIPSHSRCLLLYLR